MQLHYQSIGSGPAIILLHGFLGSASQWDKIATVLAQQYHVIIPELPGHGKSSFDTEYQIVDVAKAVHRIADDLAIQKLHFIGHSMGGYVGGAFAKAYPQKLHSLTLLNSILGADSSERKNTRNHAIRLIDTHAKAFTSMAISNLFTKEERISYDSGISQMKKEANNISLSAITAALKAMRDRLSTLSKNSEVPLHYIYGRQDQIIPAYRVNAETEITGTNATMIDGGHMLLMTHEEAVAERLLDQLKIYG